MKNPSDDEIDELKLRRNQVTGEIEMNCFMIRMEEYFKVQKTIYRSI